MISPDLTRIGGSILELYEVFAVREEIYAAVGGFLNESDASLGIAARDLLYPDDIAGFVQSEDSPARVDSQKKLAI